MERPSVEDSFRNAFNEAEMRPSSEVWTHVELGIEKEEGKALKKRVVFYRWMAAASVVLVISLIAVGYFMDSIPRPTMALVQKSEVQEKVESGYLNADEARTPVEEKLETVSDDRVAKAEDIQDHAGNLSAERTNAANDNGKMNNVSPINKGSKVPVSINSMDLSSENNGGLQPIVYTPERSETSSFSSAAKRKQSALPPLVKEQSYKINFPKTEPDQIDLLLASIEMEEKEVKKKRNEKKETFWTSVAMAAGSYNPITTASSSNSPLFAMEANGSLDYAQVVNLSNQVSNQVEASGYSFSSGISIGGKISDRWVLQGGVNYLTQNSSYNSNTVLVDAANNFKLASLNTVGNSYSSVGFQSSNPYTVSSTLKYFNVPLQAGYLIFNKAFGWQMQGGISTDFFLQNTLSAEDAGLDKISQRSGEDSPYRTVNFSGLLGTEVSYRFGEHYRVAINPGLRYPFQSIYKSESGISAAPITFDVGLKFHYIFR